MPRRRYQFVDRQSPCNKYLRRNGHKFQVRIPLDGSGRIRLTLGSYPTEEQARFVRSRILAELGVTLDDDLAAVYAAAKVWMETERS